MFPVGQVCVNVTSSTTPISTSTCAFQYATATPTSSPLIVHDSNVVFILAFIVFLLSFIFVGFIFSMFRKLSV